MFCLTAKECTQEDWYDCYEGLRGEGVQVSAMPNPCGQNDVTDDRADVDLRVVLPP